MPQCPFQKETPRLLAERERRLLGSLGAALERTRRSREGVRELQFSELKKLVEHAFEKIPFYREKYEAAGFHPRDLKTLDDLQHIPILTKDELRREKPERLTWADGAGEAWALASSGSTGVPLKILKSDDALWYFTARNMILYHGWCEGKPLDRVLYFLDLTPDAIDCALADLLRTTVLAERLVSIAETAETLIRKLLDLQPEFVSSYPSTMRNLAMELLRRGSPYARLKLLNVTSEMLDAGTRNLFGRAFPNARIVETYTSTEAGLIGYPCALGGRMHVAEDAVIFEIVDRDGKPTAETGEVVVTDLNNKVMPLIRYKGLGDYCRWNQTECECGSPFRSIHNLEGRFVESIQRADGSLLSPYAVSNEMEEIAGIFQFQIRQRAVGDFKILIVADPHGKVSADEIRSHVEAALASTVNEQVTCEVVFVDAIPLGNGRHKVPLVVSEMGRRG